jgi:uncharacterized membrane protein
MFGIREWNDAQVEVVIGNLLRAGVSLAAVVVLLGAAVFLVRHGFEPANYRAFAGEPSDLRSFGGIASYTMHGRGRGIIQLGLLLLLATPVARVAFAAFAFAMERDWLYVCVSTLVLLILLYSLIGSGL